MDLVEARRLVDAGPSFDGDGYIQDARWEAACRALGVYPGTVPLVPDWQHTWIHRPGEKSVEVRSPRDPESLRWRNWTGSLLHHPSGSSFEWKPAYIFEATLRFMSYARGRSAAYLFLYTEEGVQYPMFLTFFADLVERVSIYRGYIHGEWTFAKRGENYSIKLLDVPRAPWEVDFIVRTEKCFLEGCEKTTEVDENSGVALEPGWLSEGRGENRRYFCGATDKAAYLKMREIGGR